MFEFWPYTNFHQLNLDWIIKEVKENNRKVEEFSEQLEQMGVSIQQMQDYIDSIDAEIQEKVDTEVPIAIQHEIQTGGFNQLLSDSHKRRIVFVGDSYGQGWTPDGSFESWPNRLAGYMNLPAGDWYNSSEGGAGFGKPSTAGNQYVPNLIQNAYNAINNPDTVTDIVIGLGYNDYIYSSSPETITSGITVAVQAAKQYFPVAKVHIFAIGFTTNKTVQNQLATVYKTYKETIVDADFHNISQALCRVDYLASDGIHPVFNGQNAIAMAIMRGLYGSDQTYYLTDLSGTLINFNLNVGGDTQAFNNLVNIVVKNGKLHLQNSYFKLISLESGHSFDLESPTTVKLAKLTDMGNYIGYYTPNPVEWADAWMYCAQNGTPTLAMHPVQFTLAQDVANNDYNVYLWVKLLGVSGSGFETLSNIWKFGIMGLNYELPFIGNNV